LFTLLPVRGAFFITCVNIVDGPTNGICLTSAFATTLALLYAHTAAASVIVECGAAMSIGASSKEHYKIYIGFK
jgi:hypothetical protein